MPNALQDDFDDDAALAKYREQRLRELKEKAVRERFGDVVEIRWVGACFGI